MNFSAAIATTFANLKTRLRSNLHLFISGIAVIALLAATAQAILLSSGNTRIKLNPQTLTLQSSGVQTADERALEQQTARALFDRDTGTTHTAYGNNLIDIKLEKLTEISDVRFYGPAEFQVQVQSLQGGLWTPISGLNNIKLANQPAAWNTFTATQSTTTDNIRFILTPNPTGNTGGGSTKPKKGGKPGATLTTTNPGTPLPEIEIWGKGEHTLLADANTLVTAIKNTPAPAQARQYTATPQEGVIGATGISFKFTLNQPARNFKRAYLAYETFGVTHWVSPVRRINGKNLLGGAFIFAGRDWTPVAEPLHPDWLNQGSNTLEFTLPTGANGTYSVRNVRVILELDDGHGLIQKATTTQNNTESDNTAVIDGDLATGWSPYNTRYKSDKPALTLYFDKPTQLDTLSINLANTLSGTLGVDILVNGQWQNAGLPAINVKQLSAGWNNLSGFAQRPASALRLNFQNGDGSTAEIRDISLAGSGIGPAYTSAINISYPDAGQFYGREAYIRGYLSLPDNGSGPADISIAGSGISGIRAGHTDGSFGLLITKEQAGYGKQADAEPWQVTVEAAYPDGQKLSKIVFLTQHNDASKAHGLLPANTNPGMAASIVAGAVSLDMDADAVDGNIKIKVIPLAEKELPPLDPGMTNVTPAPQRGYRFTPTPYKFKKDIRVTIPYDPALIPAGMNENDIKTFYFDVSRARWVELTRHHVDAGKRKVTSLTNHFTDMINATLTVPDHPEAASFNATQMKDIKAADPGAGINLIEPPKANNMGDARLSYPIEIPQGRQGMQPQLAISYNSSGGNGWLGQGWDLSVPSISIETRWGVPRYEVDKESETYVMSGEQLVPLVDGKPGRMPHRTAADQLQTRVKDKQYFAARIEGSFRKIIRHGDTPTEYWWEVVEKNGMRNFYGGTPETGSIADAVLQAVGGNGTNPGTFQWMLVKTLDAHENSVSYQYTRVNSTGLENGAEPGTNLYINTIRYTSRKNSTGKYFVNFIRASQLGEATRKDIQIDARGGFKRVTDDLLRKVEVRFDDGSDSGKLIRAYKLAYNEDIYGTGIQETAYGKTLLSYVAQSGADGIKEFNRHRFTYFDDIRDGATYHALELNDNKEVKFDPWSIPYNSIKGGFSANINGFTDQASALSGQAGSGSSDHIMVSIGPNDGNLGCKSYTVGGKKGSAKRTGRGMISLTDIDGDGLPDKVIDNGAGLKFYASLAKPETGALAFSSNQSGVLGQAKKFAADRANSSDSGVEAVLGCAGWTASVGGNSSATTTTTQVYYADVNGDGLIDIVDNGKVYFNSREGTTYNPGAVKFVEDSSQTPSQIVASAAAAGVTISAEDAKKKQDRLNEENPLHDTVKVWVASFDGVVAVRGAVKLNQDNSSARTDYGDKADGVRVRIETRGNILWEQRFDGKNVENYIEPDQSKVGTIQVSKGERIYFRVQSWYDGEFDQVSWAPRVEYHTNSALQDSNGKPVYQYTSNSDYLLSAHTGQTVTALLNGKLKIDGTLSKEITSDDVTLRIYNNQTVVFEKSYTANQAVNEPVALNLDVNQFDNLRLTITSDTAIAWEKINWKPVISYISSTDPNSNIKPGHTIYLKPAIEYGLYSDRPDIANQPQNFAPAPWVAPRAGRVIITPRLGLDSNAQGKVVFSVKRNGSVLHKRIYTMQPGIPVNPVTTSMTLDVAKDDTLWLEYHSRDVLAPYITMAKVVVDYDDTPADEVGSAANAFAVPYHAKLIDTRLGPLYRQWGQFAYNGNNTRADQAIIESDLYVDTSGNNFNPNAITGPADLQGKGYDTVKAKFVVMLPDFDTGRWIGYDKLSWLSPEILSSSRLGEDDIVVRSGTSSGVLGASGPLKISESSDSSYQIGGGYSFEFGLSASGGYSHSDGTTRTLVDYMDLNGDRYPDVIVPNGIQYTNSLGGLGSLVNNSAIGVSRSQVTEAQGVNAGGSYSKSQKNGGGSGPKNIHDASMNMPSAGISGSYGESKDSESHSWADVNGDGLPDRVYKNGEFELNLGYRFGAREKLGFGETAKGYAVSSSAGLGINIGAYSIGGGVSISKSDNEAKESLMDVNGDGLPDRVWLGSPLQVAFNTGAGFTKVYDWNGVSSITKGSSATESISAYFTVCYPVPPVFVIKICVNPGGGTSTSMGRQESQLSDVNGDGLPDYVLSNNDGDLRVALNRNKRTNLLKQIQRPLGATIKLDYQRIGNTYAMPHSRWVLSRVTVDDGFAGDGVDKHVDTYKYRDGYYNRYERDFYGFAEVVEEQLDASQGNALYRTYTMRYFNQHYYGKGLELSNLTSDADGNKYIENINTWQLRDLSAPDTDVALDSAAPGNSPIAAVFPMLVRTERHYYEGGKGDKFTFTTQKYDAYGNINRFFDAVDGAKPEDDVEAEIEYAYCTDSYILNKAKRIDVKGAGKLMRSRTGKINCGNGDMIELSQHLENGQAAITKLSYFDNGNLMDVEGPLNYRGQRARLHYEYDDTVQTHAKQITERNFNYTSNAEYDLLFGKPLSTTDINGNVISYVYDQFGRTTRIKGPYEQNSTNDTLSFEYQHEALTPYALTRHLNKNAAGQVQSSIDTVLFIDGLKRVLQTKKSAAIDGRAMMTVSGRLTFDAMGRTIEHYYPVAEQTAQARNFNYTYDDVKPSRTKFDVLDRPLLTTQPDGAQTRMDHDFGADRNSATQFRTVITDAKGKQKETFRDIGELITSVKEYNAGAAIWTSYRYDPMKQIIEVQDTKGNLTLAEYDNLGRRTALQNPDTGRTETVYDTASNVIAKITANLAAAGESIQYEYDINRLTGIRYPVNAQNNVSYLYGSSQLYGNGKNQVGRITSVSDASGSELREYGKLGETTKEVRTIASHTQGNSANSPEVYTTQYQYDTFGRILKLTLPDSELITYVYDAGGNLESFAGDKANQGRSASRTSYLQTLHYDKFEQRTWLKLGNGIETRYTYNPLDRRLSNLNSQGNKTGVFQNLAYTYDQVGNITDLANQVQIPAPSTMGGSTTQHFDYDDLHRLIHAHGTFNSNPDKLRDYTLDLRYNEIHNILAKTQLDTLKSGPSSGSGQGKPIEQKATSYDWEYRYDSSHPHAPTHIGGRSYQYDLNGNQTSWHDDKNGTRRILLWDEDNRIKEILDNGDSSRYVYDDQGQRTIKTSRQGETVYVNQYYVVRNRSIVSKHLYAGNTRIATHLVMGTAPGNSYRGAGSNPQATGATQDAKPNAGQGSQGGLDPATAAGNDKGNQGKHLGQDKDNTNQGHAYGQDKGNNGQGNNGQDKQNQGQGEANRNDNAQNPDHGKGNAEGKSSNSLAPNGGEGRGEGAGNANAQANPDKGANAYKGNDSNLPGNSQAGLQNALNNGQGKKLGIYKHLTREGYTVDDEGNIDIDPAGPTQPAPANPHQANGQSEFTYYYHPDHLGSTGYVTDANGELYEHIEYFPFGETWVQEHSNTLRTPYLYTGKELDQETGLYYFGARYYDPRTSVWQSADPILGKYLPTGNKDKDAQLPGMGGAFNSLNLAMYTYGHQNPIKLIDPDGNAPAGILKHITEVLIKAAQKEIPIRNMSLAGKTHPVTNVPFTKEGFPDFSAWVKKGDEVKITPTLNRKADEKLANEAAGYAETPKGSTWHHKEGGDGTEQTMQLVPRNIHDKTGHTGGYAILQKAAAIAGALASEAANATPQDWAEFGLEMGTGWMSPSQMGNGSLYGPGTPYSTGADFDKAMKQKKSDE